MTALIVTDLQHDFVPGGALPVPEGNQIVPLINELQKKFKHILATQDWHPPNHVSFASNHGKKPGDVILVDGIEQVLWPVHCVQNTYGADFVKEWDRSHLEKVFHKGVDPRIDSYSGFFDNEHKKSTGLGEYLKQKGIHEVVIVGLATDYCVKYTALDALALGFKTTVVEDCCRGIDLVPGDVERTLQELQEKGALVQ